ncbi:MAG: hypothetical protein EP315_07260 [Gammaproteobacteria bacterium]|nr:MAG: hypothetical protein EP315_07260 [Gammaproteobacteria bacterium]
MLKSIAVFILIFITSVATAGPTEEVIRSNAASRIDGVTRFLVDRANESYFYIFEKKMRDNQKFACYFPETYSYIQDGDLKALLKTREIWQETMDNDFKTLQARVVAHGINATIHLDKVAMKATNEYAELLRYLMIKIGDETYALSAIPLDASPEVKAIINGFTTEFNTFRDQLLQFDSRLSAFENLCTLNQPTADELKAEIDKLQESYRGMERWLQHIQQYKSDIKVDLQAIDADCKTQPDLKVCEYRDRVFDEMLPKIKQVLEKPLVRATAYLVALNQYINNIDRRESYTAKVVEAFKVIREEKLEDNEQIMKFKRYALFIAQVADSSSAEQVENLLKEYTLPVTSFLAKREHGESVMMITAYMGYSAGTVLNDDMITSDNLSGFYVPIGLEYSRGLHNGASLSLMLSPVDFGYPVSLKLNGIEENIEFDEIVAPSISLAYGIKNYPVNFGIAFQKGKRFDVQNQEEKRLLLFIAFDMPLFAF